MVDRVRVLVEANALKDVNSGLTNALTNMYGQDYQTSMGRNLQRYQGDPILRPRFAQ